MKLHTGDTVLVISGKDKGKTGSILRTLEDKNRVVVAGINIRTKHVKKTFQQAGRILKFEAAISASNVMILDPKTGKPARIGYTVDEKGKKVRISKISGEEVKNVKPKAAVKGTKGTKDPKDEAAKDSKVSKTSKESPDAKGAATPTKKQPFWKRMGFGSTVAEQGEVKEAAHSQQDHTIPGQQLHSRSAGRGS